MSADLRQTWRRAPYLSDIDITLLNEKCVPRNGLGSFGIKEQILNIRRSMYIPIFRYTPVPSALSFFIYQSDLRDGLGIRIDIQLEHIGTIVHQTLNPFVQIGNFIQAHLEHDSTERFSSICPFLLQELTHYYSSAWALDMCAQKGTYFGTAWKCTRNR
jgi:hypothetical protein